MEYMKYKLEEQLKICLGLQLNIQVIPIKHQVNSKLNK